MAKKQLNPKEIVEKEAKKIENSSKKINKTVAESSDLNNYFEALAERDRAMEANKKEKASHAATKGQLTKTKKSLDKEKESHNITKKLFGGAVKTYQGIVSKLNADKKAKDELIEKYDTALDKSVQREDYFRDRARKAKIAAAIGIPLAAAGSAFVTGTIVNNQNQTTIDELNDKNRILQETVVEYQDVMKQLNKSLDATIAGFHVKESDIFAAGSLDNGAPDAMNFGDGSGNIEFSQTGKRLLGDGKDGYITGAYFLTANDKMGFVKGYANGYMSDKITSLIDEVADLTEKVAELEAVIAQPGENDSATIANLKSQIAKLTDDKQSLTEQLSKAIETQESIKRSYETQIEALKLELTQTEQKLNVAESSLSQAIADYNAVSADRDVIAADRDKLQTTVNEQETTISNLEKQLKDALADNANASEINRLNKELAAAEATNQKLSQAVANANALLEAKETELANTKKEMDVLEGKYNELWSANNDALVELGNTINALKNAEEDIADLKETNKELQGLLNEANATIKELEEENKQLSGNNSKGETPNNGNNNTNGSNTPVADENNPNNTQKTENDNNPTSTTGKKPGGYRRHNGTVNDWERE